MTADPLATALGVLRERRTAIDTAIRALEELRAEAPRPMVPLKVGDRVTMPDGSRQTVIAVARGKAKSGAAPPAVPLTPNAGDGNIPPPDPKAAPDTQPPVLRRGARRRWTDETIAQLKVDYLAARNVLDVARQYGITKGRLYTMASERGWSRGIDGTWGKPPPAPTPEVVAPGDDAKRWPLPKRAIVTANWKAGMPPGAIAQEATRQGYPMRPAHVIAAVAQLGLTNDADRRRAMHGGGAP